MARLTVTRCAAETGIPRRAVLGIVLVLILMAVLSLAGCSNSDATTTTTTENPTSTTEAMETTTTSTSEATTTTSAELGSQAITQQESEARLVFSGKWKTVSASSASGKAFAYAGSPGSSVTIRFWGTSVAWIAKKSPAYGQAKVTVDGSAAGVVDLYSASPVWKKKVWESGALEKGEHTVVISWTGKKTTGAEGTNINVDAVVVTGVLMSLYQQNSSKLSYEGAWQTGSSSGASKGSYTYANAGKAAVTVRFTGTRLVWIARTGPSYGQATVTLDGGEATTVDLYSSQVKSQQKVWDSGQLPLKTHTLKIVWTGKKNASAKGTSINVDAFDVTGYLK